MYINIIQLIGSGTITLHYMIGSRPADECNVLRHKGLPNNAILCNARLPCNVNAASYPSSQGVIMEIPVPSPAPPVYTDPASLAYLEVRLSDPTCSLREFQSYCIAEAHRSGMVSQGLILPDIHWFVTDAMLLQYWSAVDWWPNDIPTHPAPRLRDLAMQYPHMPGRPAYTFAELLKHHADRVCEVLLAQKRSVVTPNESREERAKRLNRERVARARARKAASAGAGEQGQGDGVPVAESVVSGPVREATEALRRVREAAAVERGQLDSWVKAAHTEMLARAEQRKARRAELDALVAEAEAAVERAASS